MQLECAAFVSLVILVVNILIKGVIYVLKNAGEGKDKNGYQTDEAAV